MSPFLAKLFGGLSALLAVAVIASQIQVYFKNKKIDDLEDQKETYIANEAKFQTAIEGLNQTHKTNQSIIIAGVKRESDMRSELDLVRSTSKQFEIENIQLRQNEHERALRAPFERGIAAGNRLDGLWKRAEGDTDRSSDDPDAAAPDDP